VVNPSILRNDSDGVAKHALAVGFPLETAVKIGQV